MAKFSLLFLCHIVCVLIVVQSDGGLGSDSKSSSTVRFPIMLKKKANFISIINGINNNTSTDKEKDNAVVDVLVGGSGGRINSTTKSVVLKASDENPSNGLYIDIRGDQNESEDGLSELTLNSNSRSGKFINIRKNSNDNNGISGYTATPAPTPSYRPSVSPAYYGGGGSTKPPIYYRPSSSTMSPFPIITTTEPTPVTTRPTTTTTTTSTTTFRPITTTSTTTTTTQRPTTTSSTTTFRPIIMPTRPPVTTRPPSSSTFVPIIGIEGEDEDDDFLRSSIDDRGRSREFSNRIGTSAKSSFFSNLDRSNKQNGGPISRGIVQPRILPISRSLKFNDEADEDSNVVKGYVFSDIKCYRTKNKEYFGATIHMKSGYHLPYLRDRPQDPLTSNECRLENLDSPNTYHMTVTDLSGCGVEQCGEFMCLTMVFPRVPTLALKDDEVTTIKCETQKSSISETKSISFAGDNLENRRSSSTVVGGGQDFEAEVGIFRQTPGTHNGLFAQRVQSGGTVQLGEPLQLRSVVRGGDGWMYSKLSEVKVWRMQGSYAHNVDKLNPSDATEVITLVDGNGCRNAEYDVIADSHPLRDPRNNLVHHFTFKSFLFRGQRTSEPIIVTARIQACQEAGECKTTDCSSIGSSSSTRKSILGGDPNVSRFKRSPQETSANANNTNNASPSTSTGTGTSTSATVVVRDFSAHVPFFVEGTIADLPASPSHRGTSQDSSIFSDPAITTAASDLFDPSCMCNEKMIYSAAGGVGLTLLLGGLAFSLVYYNYRSRLPTDSERKQPSYVNTNLNNNNNNNGTKKPPIYTPSAYPPPELPRKNTPLPPPPKNYDHVPSLNNNNNNNGRNNHKSNLRSGGGTPTEYECIDEIDEMIVQGSQRRSKIKKAKSKDDDGLYIVYCYNENGSVSGKKKLRPTSAPPSLREKKRRSRFQQQQQNRGVEGSDDTEESENSYSSSTRPRTVRSVKRIQNEKRGAGAGAGTRIRRRLSSIYREVYGNRCRSGNGSGSGGGGSFPTRISVKNIQGSARRHHNNKIYSTRGEERDADVENSDVYYDGFSSSSPKTGNKAVGQHQTRKHPQKCSSDEHLDSAYCGSSLCGGSGSVGSKRREEHMNNCHRGGKAGDRNPINMNMTTAMNNMKNLWDQNQNRFTNIGKSHVTSDIGAPTTEVAVADYSHLHHQLNQIAQHAHAASIPPGSGLCDDYHCTGAKTGHHTVNCSLNPVNLPPAHIVTKNESMTQIIILPDNVTDV